MDVLEAVRAVTTTNTLFQLWTQSSQQYATTLDHATHVFLTLPTTAHPTPVPLTTPLPLVSTKGPLNLASVIYAWESRELPFASYLTGGAAPAGVTPTAVFERHDLLDWLRGTKPQCTHLLASAPAVTAAGSLEGTGGATALDPAAPGATAGAATGEHLRGLPPRSESTDQVQQLKQIRAKEYLLRTRTSYLTPPVNKTFSHLTKLGFDLFLAHRSNTSVPRPLPSEHPPARAAPAASAAAAPPPPARSKRSASGTSGAGSGVAAVATASATAALDPIVLVPPGFRPLLNMLNAKPFLESAVFETTEDVQRRGGRKPAQLEIVRRAPAGAARKTWKIAVLDTPEHLEPADWDRVVAVFASGMPWQFHGWRWASPVDLFCRVRGYFLKYTDEEVREPVNQWNVKVLSIHRTKRHLDQSLVLEFWSDLEKWIAVNKPHLLT